MAQRVLRVGKDASLDLDGVAVSFAEYEEALREDKERNISTPIKVYLPMPTDDKTFVVLHELSETYDHPMEIVMGNTG
ncbi:MAG: hypothetical protein AAF127_11355 [Pseudomonadota bacterium]